LRHQPHLPVQRCLRDIAHINAINRDTTLRHIVKAGN
jgi:hypothetical protein